jgi:high affinity sulfate transporter 1
VTEPTAAERLRLGAARVAALLEGPGGPRLAWTLRGYRADRLTGDVTAGMALAALILPLSIGYAAVAGLPPEMGLYASIAPLLAYAVLGSSRPLVIGPDAASASMIAASIAPLAALPDDRVRLAGVLGLLVAGVFLAMRVARVGFLADLLSRPILVGYLAGVGITVALGQVSKILGGPAIEAALSVLRRVDWSSADVGAVIGATGRAVADSGADLVSTLVGGLVLAVMLLGRRAFPRIPMALLVMVGAVAASWAFGLQGRGVRVLGPVSGGLPPIGLPSASLAELLALLPGAVGLALLTFADTAATGKTFAAKGGERTDPNRELAALAVADAAAALTGGYPVSSSASRTAATRDAGARTQLAQIVAAATVLVALLLLTGPLAYLPQPALGAVILVSAMGIVDLSALRGIWRLKRSEGLIAMVALGGVMLYGTLAGVVVAVLLATLNIVRRAATPPIVEEGRRPDGTWRDLVRWGDGHRVAGVVVVRFAGPLFFASVTGLDARVRTLVVDRPDVTVVVLDLGATSDVDLTAADVVRQLAADLEQQGRRLVVARPLGHVREVLELYSLGDLMAVAGGTTASVDEVIAGLGLDPEAGTPRDEPEDEVEAAEVGADPIEADAIGADPVAAAAASGTAAGQPTPDRAPKTPIEGNRLVLRVIALAAGAVLAAGILSMVLGAIGQTPATGQSTVPNLIGLTLPRADVAASTAGFVLGPPILVPRDDQPEGTVVGQTPTGGTLADRGTEIAPIVSTGRPLVAVPDVVGLTESQAILSLTNAGFTVRRAATLSDPDVPAGSIVSTDPAAAVLIPTGSQVGYVVSSGPEPTPTPTPAPTAASPTASAAPATTAPTTGASPSPVVTLPPSVEPSPAVTPSLEPPSPSAAPSGPAGASPPVGPASAGP